MKLALMIIFSLLSFASVAQVDFPIKPIPQLTTGSLCDHPSSYRYRENIPYCDRDVSREQKAEVFDAYRRRGFRMSSDARDAYKIDHYIPLCAGGSNHSNNLWPQHKTIYTRTDNLEALVCEKMNEGKLPQKQAVSIIRSVKNDLSLVDRAMYDLGRL